VCHASELPLVFHRTVIPALNITLLPAENALSDTIVGFWTSFASSGHAASTVPWPVWDPQARTGLLLQEDIAQESSAELCGMWDAIGYNY
jgi:carboxylesterase type B